MKKKRIIELLVGNSWHHVEIKDLRDGNIFHFSDKPLNNWIASSDPKLGLNKGYPNVWGVEADPYNKPIKN